MKQINKYISERLHINKDTGNHDHHHNYHPASKNEFKELLKKLIDKRGYNADLNDIDTSEITSMSNLFNGSKFNGDISQWDVSNVYDMNSMFAHSSFTCENGDISKWDVSKVKDMSYMFDESPLEKNPPKWYK